MINLNIKPKMKLPSHIMTSSFARGPLAKLGRLATRLRIKSAMTKGLRVFSFARPGLAKLVRHLGKIKFLRRILFPLRNLSKRNQKITIGIAILLIIVVVPIIAYSLLHLRGVEAAWFDENFGFRKAIPVTSTEGSAQSNVFVSFTLDTATLITAGKLQGSCQDIRITDVNGKLLKYHIGRSTGCNSATTAIDFLLTSFPDGQSTYYVYYGNPSASSADGGTLTVSQASAATVTASGNEITDVVRTTNTSGDGVTPPDSSYGIWQGTTNLATNGGFETDTTGWTGLNSATLTRDTSQNKFGAASGKIVCSGTQYCNAQNGGVSLTSGSVYTYSVWVNRTETTEAWRIDINGESTGVVIPTVTGWQKVTLTITAGSTHTGFLRVINYSAAPTSTIYFDGAQFETGSIATPYVETNGGTAARVNNYVSSSVYPIDTMQGWWAARVRMGYSSSSVYGGPIIGQIGADAGNRITLTAATDSWRLINGVNGSYEAAASTVSFNAGDYITVVGYWTKTTLAVSVNGANFTTASRGLGVQANTTPAHFAIGSWPGGGAAWLNGNILWTTVGKGILSNSDAAAIHSFGDTDPTFSQIATLSAGLATPTFLWTADTAADTINTYAQTPGRNYTIGTLATEEKGPSPALYWKFDNVATNSAALTFSGNEITDATRTTNTQGDGVTPPDSSYGIWQGTTNLVTNGGFETNTTGWTSGGNYTIARSTTVAKFGTASVKASATADSGVENAGVIWNTTLTSTQHQWSAWIYIPSAWTGGQIGLDTNVFGGSPTPATGTNVNANMSLRDQWQRVVYPFAPDPSALGGQFRTIAATSVAGQFYYVDGAQLEASSVATPYVETNGGTAARSAARVQAPSTVLDATQGWVAVRVRMGYSSTDPAAGRRMFAWLPPSGNGRIDSNVDGNIWYVNRDDLSAGPGVGKTLAYSKGDIITYIGTWTATTLGISLNGSTFITAGNTHIPTNLVTTFEIGDLASGNSVLDSDFLWATAGTGTLTDANAATINGWGNTDPSMSQLAALGPTRPTFAWAANNTYLPPTYTISDSTTNANTANVYATTLQSEDQCLVGKCLFFNGTTSKVIGSKIVKNVQSVSFWVKPNALSATTGMIDLDGGTHTITANASGVVAANGFSSPAIYVNGKLNGAVSANKWNHIEVTTASGFDSSAAIQVGTDNTNFTKGYFDEIKIYPFAKTIAQVKADFNSRGSKRAGAVILGSAATPGSVLSNGLVGYWKMDEGLWNGTSGEMVDSSSNGNNGTTYGNAIATPSGKFGNAGYFDGDNDTATISAATSLDFTATGSYSVGLWINPAYISSSANGTSLIAKTNTGNGWDLHLTSTGALGVVFPGSSNCTFGGSCYSTSTILPTNQWSHVVFTYNAGAFNLYLNGVLIKSATVNGAINNTSNSIKFSPGNAACSGQSSCAYNGKMDEARVYNRALSAADVATLYNWAPGPVAYYNFEEGQGTTVNDTSGNSNTGTWNGTGATHWSSGKYGKGGNFNGSTDYVDMGAPSSLNVTGAVSISAWVYQKATVADYPLIAGLVDSAGSGVVQYGLRFDTTNHLNFWTNGSTGNQGAVSASTYSINQWHYVTGVYDGSAVATIYVDGVKAGTTTQTGSLTITSPTFRIGFDPLGSTRHFTGIVDEVRIYNYARSAKQIVSDMNAGHPNVGSPVGSAVGYWKFDEGYGVTANNSGNGGATLNGTITGATWKNDGKFGKALVFNGVNDQVYGAIPSNTFAGDFTITAWFNHRAVTAWGAIFSNSVGTNETAIMTMRNATTEFGIMRVGIVDSGVFIDLGSDHYNKWIYGVIKREGSTLKVYAYKDGQLIKNSGTLSWTLNTDNEYYIGRHYSGATQIFNGTIDEVKVYNYALSDNEIKTDYNRGSAMQLGSVSDTSRLTGGSVASNSASAAYCIPGDSGTCSAPVAEWSFEEGQGLTANDTSGNNNYGTWNGTAPYWTQGKIGKGGNFNGTDDYVLIADSTSMHVGDVFTLETWLKRSNTQGAPQRLISGSTNSFLFSLNASNQLLLQKRGNGTTIANSSTTITDQTWHHAVLTKNGATTKIYIDGKDVTTTGTDLTMSDSTNTFFSGNSSEWFPGSMDAVRIFNYARTPAQVAWDYNRGGPVGWWKFDECQGPTLHDSSGNGNNGTITIGATIPQSVVGTCLTPTDGTGAWYNGRNGKFNASLNFDGVDDYVSVTDSPSISPTTAVTISQWFYPTAAGSASNDLATVWKGNIGSATDQSYGFIWDNVQKIKFRIGSTTTITTSPSLSTISLNQWTHVLGVYDGTNLKIYINGKLDNTVATAITALKDTTQNLYIGASYTSTPFKFFTGQIDDVRIYNYALTKQQIQQVYNQGSSVRFGPSTGTP